MTAEQIAAFETALTTVITSQGDQREAIRALAASSRPKQFAEALGITWQEWRDLPVPARDRLTLRAYRQCGC